MAKLKFEYSTKNIPLSSKRSYKLLLVEKIEMVIKQMRWKAIFHDTKKEKTTSKGMDYAVLNTTSSKGACHFWIQID